MSEYKALYRKWRPYDFDDVSGQKAITDILKYEVSNNKISHAYLFCGSRGTGKTSCAKILAKAVNCLNPRGGNPCNECEACRSIDAGIATDVIEMDAASNNGVGDVRSLKDEITFTPALLKYRVYIIDEVHMMSGPAFNALLKTLEEPPSYVVFILATTEYHKLPTTIVSRCQRFDFRRMSSDVIVERLNKISASEGITLCEDGARLIARASRGGMRDAVSLLELCSGSHLPIDARLVSDVVGTGDRGAVYKLIRAVGEGDFDTVYSVIADVVTSSGDISVFWQELIDSYRDVMVVKSTDSARQYLDLTDVEYKTLVDIASLFTMARLSYHTTLLEGALADMQRATNSKRSVAEIALTRMCEAKLVVSLEALAVRVEELEKQLAMMKMGVPTKQTATTEKTGDQPQSTVTESQTPSEASTVKQSKVDMAEKEEKSVDVTVNDKKTQPYHKWRSAVERIGELKRSLASQFGSSNAYVLSDGSIAITMNEFFAARLSANVSDFAIVRGVVAELEGKSADEITLRIKGIKPGNPNDLQKELEKLINQ